MQMYPKLHQIHDFSCCVILEKCKWKIFRLKKDKEEDIGNKLHKILLFLLF